MLLVLYCLIIDHDIRYTAAAVIVCILGSFVTMRLFSRVRVASGVQKVSWLFLAGVNGGATIWTTHFVAMLGYIAAGTVGYDPTLTGFSLVIAIVTMTTGLGISAYGGRSAFVEAGGAIVGLGIAAMHYTGMAAYNVQGFIQWNKSYVIASLILGAVFGALAVNRIARPINWFCKHSAVAFLILAIASMHYTGMASMTFEFDPRIVIEESLLSPALMGGGAIGVTVLLFALGLSTYVIDAQSTQQAVARYRHLSLHDPLTGIPNRAAFIEHLTRFTRDVSTGAHIALLSIDLDRFKEINDVHGHAAGDAVLRTIADRASSVLRSGEFLARMGGDEFVALTKAYYTRADGTEFAKRLIEQINMPVEWNGHSFTVGASVGISVRNSSSVDADTLIAQADVAMYRAKNGIAETICFYDKSMDDAARERNALAIAMRAGLENNEFELYYQQQNDTNTGSIVGFETLLRWKHPTRGMISPADFIPIAEQNGFIVELGEWVLAEACTQAARWKKALSVAVNVAPQQLADNDFPDKVDRILRKTGLQPARLELEITEGSIIADHRHALTTIRRLKALGVKIAMDDYGTGYSSLSTLQSFPFDKIKIDRAFIDGLSTNVQSEAIVRSTLILAHSLNIPVLAEGVETQAHIEFLRREGCLQVQGFFFGKPGPVTSIANLVGDDLQSSDDQAGLDDLRYRAAS
ncbi:putative bifunctional diguanylate cyclase/phosphodiesterase [Agrobacterium sp. NPDC090273]|uniref:putative bifunctional diguanylate cyclase/phosphodiesterase n=1 Tax=Agrobacterium sp. NPDC090273 TaxID=3363919 RepID=UPI00383AAAD2